MKLNLIKEKKKFVSKEGGEIEYWQLSLELPSGWKVAVKPVFGDRRDRKDLEDCADEVKAQEKK